MAFGSGSGSGRVSLTDTTLRERAWVSSMGLIMTHLPSLIAPLLVGRQHWIEYLVCSTTRIALLEYLMATIAHELLVGKGAHETGVDAPDEYYCRFETFLRLSTPVHGAYITASCLHQVSLSACVSGGLTSTLTSRPWLAYRLSKTDDPEHPRRTVGFWS